MLVYFDMKHFSIFFVQALEFDDDMDNKIMNYSLQNHIL